MHMEWQPLRAAFAEYHRLLQTDKTVGNLRQRLHDYEGILTVVTYHPAYLLRTPADKNKSWDDLRYIHRLIEENQETKVVLILDRADTRKIKFYQSPFEIYSMV